MYTAATFTDHAFKAVMDTPESATSREYLLTSGTGAYSAASICGCNTRKYHGLLVAPRTQPDDEMHVLISSLDEKVLSEETAWRLSTHRYTGVYYPEGYRYISDFSASPFPSWTYHLGNARLRKELLFAGQGNTLLVRYTLLDAPAAITIFLLPMLACRHVHTLAVHNNQLNTHVTTLPDGIAVQPYEHYNTIYLQLSSPAGYSHAPDWYHHYEYVEEQRRGYDFHEDLYTPGYFELKLEPGSSVIVAAGVERIDTTSCDALFSSLAAATVQPRSMEDHLRHAAGQFIIQNAAAAYIKAGYYWFDAWGRDTCISLPGLTLLNDDVPTFTKIINTLLAGLKDGLLANNGAGPQAMYNTADASLWFIWALQQLVDGGYGNAAATWETYGSALSSILQHYRQGTHFGIRMDEDGLITAGHEGYALTWMDVVINGRPVTARSGKAVELNALWYNAVCFCLQLAHESEDNEFIKTWEALPAQIRHSFVQCFWDPEKRYLADCVQADHKDWSVRPNQLFAVSLPYSPLTRELQENVMDKIISELLTSRGLRTLSAADPHYCAYYGGDQLTRDKAYHQGTVWPWLLAHFADACLKIYQQAALPMLETLYTGMEPVLQECCLYTIPEVFDGDTPRKGSGAVAQAWSVAELLRMKHLIDKYKLTQ